MGARGRSGQSRMEPHVVDERGVLGGVSAGVGASTAASHHPNVPTGFVVPWGQGPLLLAAERISML
jgi:hypothetical protein